ncbi:uncharacterized protein L3040_007143 [Drepanopeziza brunnea f. sp. 'multigermtubi']|uniref:Thioredoxin domain-containing protein n=1 Tax=Marssonina brunnea f. sp. multigermtubi (strain MB_m1) TaxID=1072389 RepID=K1WLE1_MARBU|nr:uncharacterized protein MBM_08824 [Drepanopeziza brunnea f. sp. 'multigermtubi' MB_m1]EKD13062.1 hypothetical protein MBM_08824 [Drepanopeziza brunnea f. sp. 'multigermtubi' MB_m1]KAJ5038276.1 hypothetical protein L3040_007143 [Drepanopeziza brunnea f. sp. 'multigermtubi']
MTFKQELGSWMSPKILTTSPVPEINSKAPSDSKLPLPPSNGKPTIVTFLRHCGCPFAEKTFLSLRSLAAEDSSKNYIAVSHSSSSATQNWLSSLDGAGKVQVIVDDTRELYAAWGLGVSSTWHVLNPWSLYSVYTLGKKEGIWNKPTESGSRWQTSGSFAVDGQGKVKWVKVPKAADEVPDFGEATEEVGGQA